MNRPIVSIPVEAFEFIQGFLEDLQGYLTAPPTHTPELGPATGLERISQLQEACQKSRRLLDDSHQGRVKITP